jgi:hypothetical protein
LRSRKQLLNRPSSSSSIHSCFAPTAAHSRRQHMCAHVSIRQHMSAYVSIRQHTCFAPTAAHSWSSREV